MLWSFYQPQGMLAQQSILVTISVHDYAAVSADALLKAEAEARRIFRQAGVETTWPNCSPRLELEKVEPDDCSLVNSTHLVLKILETANNTQVGKGLDVLGSSLVTENRTSYYAYAYYDRIQQLAEGRNLGHALLAAVLVHEIGHLLLRSNAHSPSGIMCGRWSGDELRQISEGIMYFTPTQSRLIQTRVQQLSLGTAKQDALPFLLYNNNLIIVKGSIGPIKDLNIILDTGTSPTTVSRDIAQRLNLSGNSQLQMTLDGMALVQSAILSHIQVGGLGTDSLPVVVQDLSFVDRKVGIPVAVIAGFDVLSSGNFTIDYQKREIVFGLSAATKKSVRLETRTPFLTVKANIDGRELQLLVDSGTPGILIYRKRFEPKSERCFSDNTLVETATGTSQSRWFLASSVSLGKENLGRRRVVIEDADPVADDFDGLLGLINLGFHRVTFDLENGLLGWD